jgi:hypothetical protein
MNTTDKKDHIVLGLLAFISIVFIAYRIQDFLIPLYTVLNPDCVLTELFR